MKICNTSVVLAALMASAGVCSISRAGVYRTISPSDGIAAWNGIDSSANDPADATGVDFRKVYVANDDTHLYFRFDLETNVSPNSSTSNYYFNTDGDSGSGFQPSFAAIGSEFFIQSGFAYQQTSGAFNDGQLSNTAITVSNISTADTISYEYSVPLDTNFQFGARANSPIFTSDTVTLLLTDDASGDSVAPISYTLAPVPEPASIGLVAMAALPLLRRRRRS